MTPVEEDARPRLWNVYMADSSTKDGSGGDLIIKSPTGARYEHALKILFKASNDKAEYEALVVGIEHYYIAGVDYVQAFSDS